MKGIGILKGLGITFKRFFAKKITQDYPDVMPDITPRSHGSFVFYPDRCISCGICVNECPNDVIKLETSKNAQGKKVLEKYSMNLGYCLFCGFCVDSCPKSAINWKTDFELACFSREGAVYSWNGEALKPLDTGSDKPADSKDAASE